jgi:hypothetical protein
MAMPSCASTRVALRDELSYPPSERLIAGLYL